MAGGGNAERANKGSKWTNWWLTTSWRRPRRWRGRPIRTPLPSAPNLELLVGSVNTEARLVPGAVQGTHWSLADTLRNRIDVSHWAHEHPEISAEAIDVAADPHRAAPLRHHLLPVPVRS